MATKRAMQHLQALVELDERAEAQLNALASTLRQVIAQMDAILDDADQPIDEVLIELTTGLETSFTLARGPVKADSVDIYLNTVKVPRANYTIAGNLITPANPVPAGKRLTAKYTVEGLKAQTVEIIEAMDDLTVAQFATKRAKYLLAAQWIEAQPN